MIRRAACLLPCLLLLLPVDADAQSARRQAPPPDPLFDHTLSVTGSLGYASTDTTVRLDASDGTPGTVLDAEDDLGLDEQDVAERLEITLRPRERHRIRLALAALPGDRRASVVPDEDLRVGDDVYAAGETLRSKLRFRAWSASYAYSVLRQPRFEVALSAGVASIGVLAETAVPERGASERFEETVPVPQLGVEASFRVTPRWYAEARYQYFDLSASDARGRLTQLDLAVMFQVNDHLSAGLGYALFDADADFRDPGDSGLFRFRTDGVMLVIRAGL